MKYILHGIERNHVTLSLSLANHISTFYRRSFDVKLFCRLVSVVQNMLELIDFLKDGAVLVFYNHWIFENIASDLNSVNLMYKTKIWRFL